MIIVNGQPEDLEVEITLKDFLKNYAYDERVVAVSLNEIIIPKSAYESTIVKDGAVLEIIKFVAGG
ncbi:MAG: hypothetical protein AMR96_01665 [Candidatus Adiutrix intracellularis]|jgi:sulfur carrier protein|nr:MAG: hypothetical protein AMR96_01665 [Candidatus Adiutrix intracellularis]MDR2827403.1 sulfur carrier protein ThiS [Candidatus Adiutrix intracellularis]